MATLTKMVGFVTTTNPEEAKSFYGGKLGFALTGDDDFALVFDANGTMLRVGKGQSHTPAQGTILGWQVDDIESAVADLVSRGIAFEQFNLPFLKQEPNGVWTAPGGDRVAWFKDPDGNVLSISQHVHYG
jgi:catechol 2,3-dioxygenase-like lactoylglutathione lyase family enzyme